MWGEGDFPFLFVQLANYAPGHPTGWPELRESQLKTLELRNTGMAVIIDIGDSKNIHPTEQAGRRAPAGAGGAGHGLRRERSSTRGPFSGR